MKTWLAISGAAILAAAAGAGAVFGPEQYHIYKAKEAVKRLLRDPDSAVFPDVKVGEKAVCGRVNSRNAYGAMAGATVFVVKDGQEAELEPIDLFHDDQDMERARDYWLSMLEFGYESGKRAGEEYKKVLREQKQYLVWLRETEEVCQTAEERLAEAAKAKSAN